MSNSFELLTGPIDTIQKKYEILSDIVSDIMVKSMVHKGIEYSKYWLIDLLVYYEVPEGHREEVKRRFNSLVITVNPKTNKLI